MEELTSVCEKWEIKFLLKKYDPDTLYNRIIFLCQVLNRYQKEYLIQKIDAIVLILIFDGWDNVGSMMPKYSAMRLKVITHLSVQLSQMYDRHVCMIDGMHKHCLTVAKKQGIVSTATKGDDDTFTYLGAKDMSPIVEEVIRCLNKEDATFYLMILCIKWETEMSSNDTSFDLEDYADSIHKGLADEKHDEYFVGFDELNCQVVKGITDRCAKIDSICEIILKGDPGTSELIQNLETSQFLTLVMYSHPWTFSASCEGFN